MLCASVHHGVSPCTPRILSKELRQLKVVRVKLNNGQRVIGLRYYEPLIAMVSKTLPEKFEHEVSVYTQLW